MAKRHLEQYDKNGNMLDIYLNDDEVIVGDKTLEEKLGDMQTAIDNAASQGGIQQETDPTVPSWAKQPTKPTYTAQEVGAVPAAGYVATSNDYTDADKAAVDTIGSKANAADVYTKSQTDAAIQEAVEDLGESVETITVNGVTKTPDEHGDVDLGNLRGQDGNSGVASSDGLESVNNLNGGTTDTQQKVYVLGANQGKVLADMIGTCYKKTGGMTTQKVYGALGISQGSRSIGTGWQLNQSSSNRAYSLLMEADGSDIKVYENNSTSNVSYILEGYISDGKLKVVCPVGYRVFGMIGDQLASTTSTTHYKEFPSVSNFNGTSDLDVEIDLTVGGTISVAQFKYFTIGFAKSGDGSITGTDIATLQSSAKVFYEEEVAADGGHVAFEIVDENGTVLKSVSSTNDTNNVTMYSKSAVDELLSGIGDTDVSGYYRKANSSEAPSVITFDNIVSGSQRQPGAGIGTAAYNAKRLCVNKVFDMQDASNPFNIVKLYIPDGYLGGVTQCKVTTATSASSDYLINDFASGLIDVNLDPAYRYVTINFKRADDASTSATDVAALESAVYALSTEPQTTTKSIEIIGADGKSVKSIYNDKDGDTVQIASKAYVDKFAYGNTIRVLAWNIGHFAVGKDWQSKITDANYDEKMMQWKKVLNASCANILLLSEYNDDFGSHTVDGSSVTENAYDVLFSSYYDSISKTTQSAYVCNAILAKGTLSNGSTVPYSQSGQPMNYRVAEITIGGKTVKLVTTHLDWSQNEAYAGYRAAQIQQLITAFKNEPYVIIGGDFNVDSPTEFNPFATNGFTMLNHANLGDICTYPASGANAINTNINDKYGASPEIVLDNIIVKGFRISDVRLIDEGTMSDHCGLVADLTMI